MLRRDDYVRLLIQALNDLGYEKSANALMRESDITLQSEAISEFCTGILEGKWDLVESLLHELSFDDDADILNAKFLIYEQKYLELLEKGAVQQALECLRTNLTPLKLDFKRVHWLTGLMMCTDGEELKKTASWDGTSGNSRSALLNELRKYISAHTLVPERRLETLVLQALEGQKYRCVHHNTKLDCQDFSLFEDHQCPQELLPRKTKHILQGHTDEVWFIRYSHNGQYLASASKDKTVIIWAIGEDTVRAMHILSGHTKEANYLAWSPDDEYLVTVSRDRTAKLWDVQKGVCLQTCNKHAKAVTTCAWMPDGKHFVTAGLDFLIHLWSINGELLRTWNFVRSQINELLISPDGRWLVIVSQEKKIILYDLEKNSDNTDDHLPEKAAITSIAVSADSKYLLVNLASQRIHLWDIESRSRIRKYYGHRQGRFVIRSCFGGVDEGFVASGSEDGRVYIWNRNHGTLQETLDGHTSIVNSVSWNPHNYLQLASASDDQTIRIWEAERPFALEREQLNKKKDAKKHANGNRKDKSRKKKKNKRRRSEQEEEEENGKVENGHSAARNGNSGSRSAAGGEESHAAKAGTPPRLVSQADGLEDEEAEDEDEATSMNLEEKGE